MQFDQLKRRDFVALLGGATIWPSIAHAQVRPIVGLVSIGATPAEPANFGPFLAQMKELGYVEGQNVIFDRRFAAGDDSLIDGFVADLVRERADIIVATGTRELIATKRATSSIPIVTFAHPDPVGTGFAGSLSRPGSNVTGLTTMDLELYGKRVELLKQVVPRLDRVGVLVSTRQPIYKIGSSWAKKLELDVRSLGIALDIVEADENNLDSQLATLANGRAQGLVVTSDGVFVAKGRALAEGAMKHRLPSIFVFREQVRAGGLLAYAASIADLSRRAAFFVDRILKGGKPADLPIEQPTKFELVINLNTSKTLGLDMPPVLLAAADEVIE
ncbi:ABC transporter substrate-binding protein [Bradyrhizobium jicamae]|uniref:ABC transporter substrate-binding protein n=1 Tax=Bradyrhizobium jicamae TaxID=280332 RepID=A0ABS5FDT9_9BRAD|nr:ABC transporter substrate-binding protein [Bradyrhizobium jicamae]MBR0794950.1 ABC transporter substrate-binding protein [Bradyrhizobium jicamae]MBR0939074.1 ABC transporter substrate-binding protein [Bradyrhizobium jicamae]